MFKMKMSSPIICEHCKSIFKEGDNPKITRKLKKVVDCVAVDGSIPSFTREVEIVDQLCEDCSKNRCQLCWIDGFTSQEKLGKLKLPDGVEIWCMLCMMDYIQANETKKNKNKITCGL